MNSQSGFATLKIIFYLALAPFAMTQWVAAELQLVGGHAKGYLRTYYPDFPDNPHSGQSKTVTLTSVQLQPSHPSTTLLTTEGSRGTDTLSISSSLDARGFNILHFANLGALPYGREAEFVDRLQFLIPATPSAPAGTPVKVKVFSPEGGGIGLDPRGELLAPDWVSTVDGRASTFVIRFAGQTLDLSATPNTLELVGEVQTGTPFEVEVNLLGIGIGGSEIRKHVRASVFVTEPSQTIEFDLPQEMELGDYEEFLGRHFLEATATSGLPVSFEVVSGPGTIVPLFPWIPDDKQRVLFATDYGEITVRASQAGNSFYDAAPNVDKTIRVASEIAKVTQLQGTVTATDLLGNVVELKDGDYINLPTRISAAERSFVRLTLPDGSNMNIGPKSRLDITYDFLNRNIKLDQGHLWFHKTKRRSPDEPILRVGTPTAAMGVRGTILTVEVVTDENGMITTTTEVLEGVVDHENLLTGEMTELLAGDRISFEGVDPTPARLTKIAALNSKIAALTRKLKVYRKQRNKTKIAATNRSIRILKAQLASA